MQRKGMGMTRIQSIFKVEIPLSISVIMGGIRNALVVAIGVTAVGTFIGAGGLGDIITRGINVAHGQAIILAGALPTALMAILADVLLGWVEKNYCLYLILKINNKKSANDLILYTVQHSVKDAYH